MKKARGLVVGLLGVGIAFVVALFSFTPVGGSFEERISLPWLFRVRGSIDPPAEIVIVALNKQRRPPSRSRRFRSREFPRG